MLGEVRDACDDLDRRDGVEPHPRRQLVAAGGDVACERQVIEVVAHHQQVVRGRESPSGTHSFVTCPAATRQTVVS